MPPSRRFTSRTAGLALLGLSACIAAIALPRGVLTADAASAAQWKAIYQAGAAPLEGGSRIEVTMAQDNLVLQTKKSSPFLIPASAITIVSSSLTAERTIARTQAKVWAGVFQAAGPYTTLLFLPFGIPAMAATAPIKSKYAYVSILWNEHETDQEVSLRLDRKDYSPFLAELQKATGKEWSNAETKWANLRRELAAGAGQRAAFRLDRNVRLGQVDLKPGAYQLVVLAHESSRGEAYCFSNNQVNIEHLAATAVVDIAPPFPDTHQDAVTFKVDDKGNTTISEIRTAAQVLRFP